MPVKSGMRRIQKKQYTGTEHIINGKVQKRLWSLTYGIWIDKDWIDC